MTTRQMYRLKVGDIVAHYHKDGRVTMRVIRYVAPATRRSRYPDRRFMVGVVKQVRSRYPGPGTYLYPDDLLERHYQVTGKRVALRGGIDKKVEAWFTARTCVEMEKAGVTQNDVVGVLS